MISKVRKSRNSIGFTYMNEERSTIAIRKFNDTCEQGEGCTHDVGRIGPQQLLSQFSIL